jgi:hypothetical protein
VRRPEFLGPGVLLQNLDRDETSYRAERRHMAVQTVKEMLIEKMIGEDRRMGKAQVQAMTTGRRQLCNLLCLLAAYGMPGAADGQGSPKQRNPDCVEWDIKTATLEPERKQMLKKYGVALGAGELLISERFKDSCEFRVRLGGYWGRLISGNDSPADAAFGSRNSARICWILKRI